MSTACLLLCELKQALRYFQGLTSVANVIYSDTSRLEELIRERTTVLDNLEVAETYYIRSFQVSTSSPGSDEETSEGEERHSGPRISRPLPLGGRRRDRINQLGPGEHGGPTPTSYVAPSQYYKLRNVKVGT
jgi:hypothetical protein